MDSTLGRTIALVLAVTLASACGSSAKDDEDGAGGKSGSAGQPSGGGTTSTGGTSSGGSSSGGTSSGGSAAGGSSSGGTSSGGTSSGGSSATGGSSSGTGGGAGCTGTFGAPRTVFELPGNTLSGLTLSPDELELLYSAGPVDGTTQAFFHARRASKADVFSNPVALPELDAACTTPALTRSGDLSFDGLTLYFTCYDSGLTSESSLRIARRPSLDAPFALEPPDPGVASSPSISADGLELFGAVYSYPPDHYLRTDTSLPFDSTEEMVPGLETTQVITPEIAPDGLTLFVSQSASNLYYGLFQTARSTREGSFGVLSAILPETPGETYGSAAVSNDCRSLYYVHYTYTPAAYSVEALTR